MTEVVSIKWALDSDVETGIDGPRWTTTGDMISAVQIMKALRDAYGDKLTRATVEIPSRWYSSWFDQSVHNAGFQISVLTSTRI